MKNKILIKLLVFSGITTILLLGCELKDRDYYSNPASTETDQFTLTLNINGPDGAGVNINPPDIFCEAVCQEEFNEGELVDLISNFDPLTINFDGWDGDCIEGGIQPEFSVVMNSDITCLANFSFISEGNPVLTEGNYPKNLPGVENAVELSGINNNSQKYFYSKEVNNSSFGNLTGSFITAFAFADGYKIIDVATGEVLKEETTLNSLGPYFGIAGATQNPSGNDSPAMIILAGSNGFVLDRLDQSGPIEFNGTTFDVFPAGGDPISNVVTHVLPGAGIGFFVFDDSENQYIAADVGFPLNLFGGAQLISAYMHDDLLSEDPAPQPRGNFLVLSRETESGVFLVKWDGSNPVRAIDNIGFDPRRLRCIDDGTESNNLVCVASIYGHNRLGIMIWDGENEPVLTDFADLDSGPVGVDLRNLPDGNIAVVSTGFDNNTINETVLMPNGRVQSNSTRPVLDGCESPGHAIYIEDSEGYKILATCYDSGSYMITESEL